MNTSINMKHCAGCVPSFRVTTIFNHGSSVD